jgi:hypothetical protein
MLYQKDNQTYTDHEVRQRHPSISFALTTYAELGYSEYTPPAPDPVPYIPQVVSRFQARAILHLDGNLTTVEALVAQADALTQLAWADAQEFRRSSPSIAAIANALGWTDAYLDDLFTRASLIEA